MGLVWVEAEVGFVCEVGGSGRLLRTEEVSLSTVKQVGGSGRGSPAL